jgi:tetratricopeptide (TPR) repeat protein
VATRLVTTVRKALGDKTSDSAQLFAMTTLSASSLDVVRLYAAAQDASSNSKFDEARRDLNTAVTLDPKFGVGYQLLAVASMNLGNRQDAQKYISEALKHLDGMTERERFSTRGLFYRITGDYPACVKEYGDLLTRYAGDPVAHNQLALCSSQLRNLRRAQDEMREVVKILPKRVLFRDNLALYSSYASDFPGAEREAQAIQEPDPYSILSLAFAQLGQGRVADTIETYRRLESTNALGASLAASGLGDVAMYEGRFSDAIGILGSGAAADVASHNTDRAAAKFAALAHAYVSKGQTRPAFTAAANALTNGNAVKIRFLVARTFIEAGAIPRARPLITSLASELQAEPQAYAKIADGEIALATGDNRQAIKLFGEANALLDTWIGHYDLGRAYLNASQFAQADSEFDRCIKRRGEAMSLFLDEEPTYGYFPPVYYYQGRVRAGLQNAGFAESYRQYLDIRGTSKEDPLLAEVRRRSTAN